MSDLIIRKARESDLHEIKSLMVELIETLESEEGINKNAILENCRKILKAPNAHLLVAELNGKIVGALHLNIRRTILHSAPSGLIDELVVSKEHRGMGIGGNLIEAAVELCRELGCVEVEVSTEISNLRAREFYKSMGFEESGILLEMDLD
ncbi:hypothetical protein PAP_01065 [Palaeococcus pacificus DY20341]|uniref:N-acetyltransferase domain-containing protein n=1 Tax=Palaeococcus pacificus DY20341 TaxID=1343739 RepID=A0A075LPQ7_9EURY|nr:GNAT family N-acetyltransferase [Palaeococcus pacificus]AIF68655.1 hypothetical protein PAP_01065 [Palaeococcus pacificus DY20341]